MTTSPGGHEDDLDVEEAWAAIVANWDADAPERAASEADEGKHLDVDLRGDTSAITRSPAERGERESSQSNDVSPLPRHRSEGTGEASSDHSHTDLGDPELGRSDIDHTEPGHSDPAPGMEEGATRFTTSSAPGEPPLPAHVEARLDEHFEQPDPELPSPRLSVVAAWTLLVVVPVVALVVSILSDGASTLILSGAAASIVAGFGVLLAQLRNDEDEDDSDDGAVV